MYCKYCGTKISDDAKFCQRCGNEVEIVEATQAQATEPATDYTSVTGTVMPNQQYDNGYNQEYNQYNQPYAQNPATSFEVEELKEKIFSNGLISAIFSYLGLLSIVGIIFGAMTGKKVKKLKAMGYRLRGKTKAGEILGKVGLILGIVMTAFWVFYFGMLILMLLGIFALEGGGLYL